MSDRFKIITVRAKGGKLIAYRRTRRRHPDYLASDCGLSSVLSPVAESKAALVKKIGVGSAVFIGSSCPKMAGFGDRVVVSLPA